MDLHQDHFIELDFTMAGGMDYFPCEVKLGSRRAHGLEAWLIRSWYSSEPLEPLLMATPLRAASFIYRLGLDWDQLRATRNRKSLHVPVISVGNLVAGGTGKTPFVIWITKFLQEVGLRPAILSRGYGSRTRIPARVPSTGDTAPLVDVFGDEPVLMARKAWPSSVWVGKDRWTCGRMAIQESGAEVLVLDDGFQHLALGRDIDFVLLDSSMPFGNRQLIPAGPLREPIEHLGRAGAFVLTRTEDASQAEKTRALLNRQFPGRPVFTCQHKPVNVCAGLGDVIGPVKCIQNCSAVAFAGIAHPTGFFRSLLNAGVQLKSCFAFPDHCRYESADLTQLLRSTREFGANLLITTEKDIVRLPADVQSAIAAMSIELDFGADERPLREYLRASLPV